MITAIICEFNPFHNGHKYLIEKAKENNDAVICVMSGNFVQRGDFAVYNKFDRAEFAVKNGADIVIELPCAYSLMSAGGFAKYAVELIEQTGIADSITFGAECDDINRLYDTVKKIKDNDKLIKENINKGMSFPAARKAAVKDDILDTPNNILAVEYIKNTSLPCNAVKRIGKGHDSDDSTYSASQIRKGLNTAEIHSYKNCENAILAKLRKMDAGDFLQIEDVNEGLENRIISSIRSSTSLQEIYDKAKTKRYTHSRIRRIVMRAYLGITKEYTKDVPYIRILAFNQKGKELLAKMKISAKLPIISRYSDLSKSDCFGKKLFKLECECTDLYNLACIPILPCGLEQKEKVRITE